MPVTMTRRSPNFSRPPQKRPSEPPAEPPAVAVTVSPTPARAEAKVNLSLDGVGQAIAKFSLVDTGAIENLHPSVK
eukprot:3415936-Prymnesium_polylepis.1